MFFKPFHELFPEVAKRETRSLTVTAASKLRIPPGEYAFIELYCDEPGCDCRRVMFHVGPYDSPEPLAVVAWGWESLDFYERWVGMKDREIVKELKGPALNLGSPLTPYSHAILGFVEHVLLQDPAYVERIKRHYQMFREKIDGQPKRPSQRAAPDRWKKLPKDMRNWLKRRQRRRSPDGANGV